MTPIPAPRKAEKRLVKLKMAVQGPSGSGKTWGALALAKNLWPDGKVCVVDTENESASLYADRFEFDTIPLAPPFGTDRYGACIDAVVRGGYDVLIIDSITPQWDGEGGILRRKEEMDRRPGSNGYANWASFTPEHEEFKQAILQSPIHVICTMRSKQDYILVANDKGKQVPKKVGMAPIQRDQIDYEFTLVFDIEMDHKGSASKDRTGLFNEKIVDLASPATAEAIRQWLDRGKGAPPAVTVPNVAQAPVGTLQAPTSPNISHSTGGGGTVQTGKFLLAGDMLSCVIKAVTAKESKKKTPYLSVTFNGRVDGFNYAFCYDTKFFDLLTGAVNKEVNVQLKPTRTADQKAIQYFSISDVAWIDGVDYENGVPAQQGVSNEQPVQ